MKIESPDRMIIKFCLSAVQILKDLSLMQNTAKLETPLLPKNFLMESSLFF